MKTRPISKRERREIERRAKADARALAREPNGRASRKKADEQARAAMTEAEIMAPALEARMRHHGITKEQASINEIGSPNAGTVHGLMRLKGTLTADQWSAARWYLNTRGAYMRSILAKGEAVQPEGPGHGVEDSSNYVDWCRQVRETWQRVLDCITEISVQQRSPIAAALDVMLVRNQYLEHMAGDLRLGLNAIHKEFVAAKQKAA